MSLQDLNKKLLPLVGTGRDTFFPVYHIYFDMLKGDVWACIMMQEILRLQNSEGGKENGGWVVFTFEHIEKTYYISRHIFNNAIEALRPYGLKSEMKRHPKYPHALRGVWHYRIDEDELYDGVVNYFKNQDNTDLKNFQVTTSKNLTSSPEKISDIEEVVEEVVEDIYVHSHTHTNSNDENDENQADGASLAIETPPPSKKKSQAQTTQPTAKDKKRGNVSPVPRPPADVNTGSQPVTARGLLFRHVKIHYFKIADGMLNEVDEHGRRGLSPELAGRINGVVSFLWDNCPYQGMTDENKSSRLQADVTRFVGWWGKKYDVGLPEKTETLGRHWLQFWSENQARAQVKIVTTKSQDEVNSGDTIKTERYKPDVSVLDFLRKKG